MKTWIIEPRDPLIARDGRPFTADPGARAKSLSFPFPSTTAGTVRTRYGYGRPGYTGFDEKLIEEVKKIQVQGPLLVELGTEGEIKDWLLPAPLDAVLFEDEANTKQAHIKQLVVCRLSEGMRTDLPSSLIPVGFASYDEISKRKPYKDAPRFWKKGEYLDWLAKPRDRQSVEIKELGHNGPVGESRVHVKIDPKSQAAEKEFLYQTSGLEFCRKIDKEFRRLALAVRTAAALFEGIAPLGGEQRQSYWRESPEPFPSCCDEVRRRIKSDKACRLILLTPAHFRYGFYPDWLLQSKNDVTPTLVAAASGRPQVVSGWDYDIRKPKPTRRLTPAGSVFFLKLNGNEQNIDQWIDAIWMKCVSDDDENGVSCQTRSDGFGLAVLGVWSGEIQNMEVNS
jgi:CRISPR-associated protein Cmr3